MSLPLPCDSFSGCVIRAQGWQPPVCCFLMRLALLIKGSSGFSESAFGLGRYKRPHQNFEFWREEGKDVQQRQVSRYASLCSVSVSQSVGPWRRHKPTLTSQAADSCGRSRTHLSYRSSKGTKRGAGGTEAHGRNTCNHGNPIQRRSFVSSRCSENRRINK